MGGHFFVAGVAIWGVAAIGFQDLLPGAATSPLLLAIAFSIAIHIIVFERILNLDLRWDDVKRQVAYILAAVVGGVPNSLGTAVRAVLSYITGLSGLI